MGTTFPKDIMDCMKGCILSIFWPKKDIVDFMKKVGCTSRELMPESEYKELHRAEIVDKIFTNLEKRSDSGIGQFRCMLKELTEWNYFDPYYFQKLNKLSESEAKRNKKRYDFPLVFHDKACYSSGNYAPFSKRRS